MALKNNNMKGYNKLCELLVELLSSAISYNSKSTEGKGKRPGYLSVRILLFSMRDEMSC